MKESISILIISTLVSILSIQIPSALAANSVRINFKGNLIQNPPCEITGLNGNEITIDFQDMVIRNITGMNYIQEIKYKLTCDAPNNTGLSLSIKGTAASFNTNLLTTSNTNLGISFYSGFTNLSTIRVNLDPIKFPNSRRDPIYANPVINAKAANITAGSFTATATLLAEYE
ncbi:fimbrial protein [Providencia huaxiensis]|uniref:fimbrial protein n=1 Tax=Providencia huaxiensis TaxID=2027290 RepID=UPI0034DCD4FA